MVYYTTHYVIDWDKVETLEDMKLLLKAIDFAFEPNHQHLDSIKHLVKQEEKPGMLGYLSAAEEPPAESE